jgi:hypothetical protein
MAAGPSAWRMGRLDDLVWVHAVETATGWQLYLGKAPRDEGFIAL